MPYKLRKAPNRNLYWVVTIATGKKHSKEPIPIENAKAQLRILTTALHGGDAYAKGKASVFVLTCIDPRYNYDVTHFLENQKSLHKDYDLFTLAGASVGAEKKEWTKTFFDNLELGLKLHGIKEVWCFDHMDCGMYKATFGLEKDDDPALHKKCMDKLKQLIAKKHPQLKFREFIVSARGEVRSV